MIVGQRSGSRGSTGAGAERGGVSKYDPIVVSAESTVVSEYEAEASSDTGYQSEAELEASFIRLLESQAYEYLPMTSEAELIVNLRLQLEKVNDMTFSDAEWERFFSSCIASKNDGIVEKTVRIQENHIQLLRRDDGSTKNVFANADKSSMGRFCASAHQDVNSKLLVVFALFPRLRPSLIWESRVVLE